jgi:hypothetical protein
MLLEKTASVAMPGPTLTAELVRVVAEVVDSLDGHDAVRLRAAFRAAKLDDQNVFEPAPDTPLAQQWTVVHAPGVRVRERPALRARVIGSLRCGEVVHGRLGTDGWVQREKDGGWVCCTDSQAGALLRGRAGDASTESPSVSTAEWSASELDDRLYAQWLAREAQAGGGPLLEQLGLTERCGDEHALDGDGRRLFDRVVQTCGILVNINQVRRRACGAAAAPLPHALPQLCGSAADGRGAFFVACRRRAGPMR